MESKTRDFFISLSQNEFLNKAAKKFGPHLGAQRVVAGTTIPETITSLKKLNAQGISCTVDNLGEFVSDKEEAIQAKGQILDMIEAIYKHDVDAHISLKPSQLGLDIDYDFCLNNLDEIVKKANEYDIFVNFDMEDYPRLQPSFDIIDELSKTYVNIGTVIHAYFFRAEDDLEKYKNMRLRIVKGAYKESEAVSYQNKADIDANFIRLIEWNLLYGKFTSIATHVQLVFYTLKTLFNDNAIIYTNL